jgi:PPOX class probable F420-dependent enzyme
MLTDQARRLLHVPEFGILSTGNPDGSHHLCVMWVGRHGDDVVMASRTGRRQVVNLGERPHATVLLHSRANPLEYVEIHGDVELYADERGELVDALAHAYTGHGHVGLDPDVDVDRVRIRLRPRRVIDHPRHP